ncbi:MAG: prolyl-tRNA synthetase associated domain-containing protein [Pseudomonadota bacterium]
MSAEAQAAKPKSDAELFAYLDGLGISYSTKAHPPVFTVAESQSVRDAIPGGHTKNLFLKDKKDNFFLVTAAENAEIDLKSIHRLIGASGRVSFGKPDRLMAFLGVIPGAVTPLGVINDADNRVKVVLDAALMEYDTINAHPLRNDATTSIGRDDLTRFLSATGHEPLVVALSRASGD